MNNSKSLTEFNRAKKSIPGGVNSPVRAFKSINGEPIFIKKGKGSKIYDIDDNEYIDFVSSWGPLILGHAHKDVVKSIKETAENGTSYGAPTIIESEIAELIIDMVPSIESVRMVNSGTEATMSALRLARGYTNRELIIKFEGCYHGHADSFLIKAGSGAITLGLPDSPGVTKGTAKDTLVAKYNDIQSVTELFEKHKNQIAAVIIEPVAGNMGVIKPQKGFLEALRKITKENGALLIFDEVITGFRLAKGGAQEYFGITPDITTLGKIIGGGLPVGAYGAKKEIMDKLAPSGPIYQAGTLSGNPLAMAAGLTSLKIMNETPDFYKNLEKKAAKLEKGIKENIEKTGVNAIINRVGSMLTLFFTDLKEINSYTDAISSDTAKYAKYFQLSVNNGIYIAPSQFECAFISAAQTDEDIENAIKANFEALKQL
ncbi:MAG: glutamate-1-semialdehyde 2,1-aminomutase [Bacteroidales bacterium]|nr:glutamate-1-semialdehyde 2,1-aminomutase [Bacteroidales bacterium]MBN2756224.1 glutamate-1-semialdehyde 2,1-aminomutase [Bacteroidales bacterium]